MRNPKVSVIVPVYNVAPYLSQCLESLVNQTYRNLEIIVVNDGSTDNSPEICEQWKERDERILLIHKPNGGLSDARNKGLESATGEYIGFVDSDDYVDLSFYEKMVKAAVENDADVVQCNYYKAFSDGSVKEFGDFNNKRTFTGKECLELADALVNGHNNLTTGLLHAAVWVSLFRRSSIKDKFISERVVGSEDIPFKANIFLHCNKVTFIPDHLCYYRYTDCSLTRTFRYDLFTRYLELTRRLNELFANCTGNSHQADFLVLYMGINVIRSMYLYNCPKNLRPEYFKKLINEPVWNSLKINTDKLSKGEKLIYYSLRNKKYSLLRIVSTLYYNFRTLFPA